MKFVSLADDLVPVDPKEALKHSTRGSAKTIIERCAKEWEAKKAWADEMKARSDGALEAMMAPGNTKKRKTNSAVEAGVKKRKSDSAEAVVRRNVGDRVATLGSEEVIYSFADCGMFAAILTAYNNHWNLRTSPDDWWFCVTKRVSLAIDRNSKKDSVRKMFVEHEGKKSLTVDLPPTMTSIYSVDYSWFFNEMSNKIAENVKVPEYVDAVTADFSVTTDVQKIVSQITLMSSLQEFFLYKLRGGCGIPGVELLGTEEDWKRLKSKLKVLRTLLEPIENDIGLSAEWWALVETVFCKLLATYQGDPDKDWWSRILFHNRPFGSGHPSGYTGWIIRFMEGSRKEYWEVTDFTSGLITVPMGVSDRSGREDSAALVAGMLGFTVHKEDPSGVASVQPFQGWSLLLPENSPFRTDNFRF